MHIAIIGSGKMGKSVAKGLSKKNTLFIFDRNFDKAELIEKKGYGIACKTLQEAVSEAQMVILAIKPQGLKESSPQIAKELKDQLLISLLAGIDMASLKTHFPNQKILRMMPNLAIQEGVGMVGFSPLEAMDPKITALFEPLGNVFWLKEDKMNAFTALCGSGPAFIFHIMESVVNAGVEMGFSKDQAKAFTLQMIQGSLTLANKSQMSLKELKDEITSPKGTTAAGLQVMEDQKIGPAIEKTFFAAFHRAEQLS